MSILKIIKYPNNILRKKTKKVKIFDNNIKNIIYNMFDTIKYYKGIGLASNQVNIKKSIITININYIKIILINPKIIYKKNKIKTKEGCLSIPNKIFKTKRYNKIILSSYNLKGKKITYKYKGLISICIQHEIDHLNGKLIIDYLKK